MEDDEAKTIATTTQKVLRHYHVETTQKAIDFAALFAVLAQSYGTRLAVVAIRQRMKAAGVAPRQQQQQPQPAAPQNPAPGAANGVVLMPTITPRDVTGYATVNDPMTTAIQ